MTGVQTCALPISHLAHTPTSETNQREREREMGRAPCCDKANVKKGPWSPEEDETLKDYIEQHGTGGNWIALPQKVGKCIIIEIYMMMMSHITLFKLMMTCSYARILISYLFFSFVFVFLIEFVYRRFEKMWKEL